MSDDLGIIRKKATVAYFEERTRKSSMADTQHRIRDLNPKPYEYAASVLTTRRTSELKEDATVC
jgi:hypothetical protein